MNPDTFTGRSVEEILSTLAHEMAHVWQQSHGTPPRRCYHDQQWAAKMKEIGLLHRDTGRATGEGEESQQNENHLPGLWTERMGEAGRAFRLLRLLRGNRGTGLDA